MKNTYEFCITKPVSFELVYSVLKKMNPRWNIKDRLEDLTGNSNEGCVLINPSHDPDWAIVSIFIPDDCPNFTDIEIANQIFKASNSSILLGSVEVISGLDPQDPFWDLLLEDGQWYFVSTAETLIMGPPMGENKNPIEYRPIHKIQQLDLGSPKKGLYHYSNGTLTKK